MTVRSPVKRRPHRAAQCSAFFFFWPGRRGVVVEEVERDGRVDIGEDRGATGPELVEQPAQLVRECDALADEVIAQAAEAAERFGLVRQRRERAEPMAVCAQDVREQVGVAEVGLGLCGRVASTRSLDCVRVNRHDGEAVLDERVDENPRRALDGDPQLAGRGQLGQTSNQVGEPVRSVRGGEAGHDGAALVDGAHRVLACGPVQAHEIGHDISGLLSTTARGACRSLTDWHSTARTPGCDTLLSVKAPPTLPGGRSHAGHRVASDVGRPRRGGGGTISTDRLGGLAVAHGRKVHQ